MWREGQAWEVRSGREGGRGEGERTPPASGGWLSSWLLQGDCPSGTKAVCAPSSVTLLPPPLLRSEHVSHPLREKWGVASG